MDQGPQLQSLQTDMMNDQLTTLSRRLYSVMSMLNASSRDERLEERRKRITAGLNDEVRCIWWLRRALQAQFGSQPAIIVPRRAPWRADCPRAPYHSGAQAHH